MSRAELFEVPKEGELRRLFEYQNSWGGAMRWWTILGEHYRPGPNAEVLHVSDFDFTRDCFMPTGEAGEETMSRIWKLPNNPNVELHHQTVLRLTFDRCIVKAEDLLRLSEDLQKFVLDFGRKETGHAPAIRKHLADRARAWEKEPGDLLGVCFNWTSVTDAWYVYEEEEDDSRMYDVTKDEGHWFLYEDGEEEP